jgi:hypothetical protein
MLFNMTVQLETITHEQVPVYSDGDMPEYGVYNRDVYIPKLVSMASRMMTQKQLTPAEAQQSLDFAEQAFDRFEGKAEMPHEGSYAFMVPSRISREHGDKYKSEIEPFLPMVRNMNNVDMLNAVVGMPPAVIDSYNPDHEDKQGHVVFVPLFGDMISDLDFGQAAKVADKVINDTADFAREKLGARIAGLGAILPLLTRYGKSVRTEGLTTTTGHGGTVWLIGETVGRVVEANGMPNDTIGIVGAAGSIGSASLDLLLEKYPDAHFLLQDTRTDNLSSIVKNLEAKDRFRVKKVESIQHVLENSKIAVSAITSIVDLKSEYPDLNLDGVTIVDDSQPGAFSREDVEEKGGKLVWVVGKDMSPDGRTTRMGGYLFGESSGLTHSSDVWGCEGEVSSLAYTKEYGHAIRSKVTPAMARNIGRAMGRSSIISADFQSFGSPVYL